MSKWFHWFGYKWRFVELQQKKTNSIIIFIMDSDPVNKAIGICFPFIYQAYITILKTKCGPKYSRSTAGGLSGRLTSKNYYKILWLATWHWACRKWQIEWDKPFQHYKFPANVLFYVHTTIGLQPLFSSLVYQPLVSIGIAWFVLLWSSLPSSCFSHIAV